MNKQKKVGNLSGQAANLIRVRLSILAEAVVAHIYREEYSSCKPYDKTGREKSLRDVEYHLSYLAEALEASDLTLFTEYVAWAKVLFAGLDLPENALTTTLHSMETVLADELPAELWDVIVPYLEVGMEHCVHAPSQIPSFLSADAVLGELAQEYLELLLRGKHHVASKLITDAVDEGVPIKKIYLNVFQPVQYEVGRLWQQNLVSVAQEHYCTAATQLVMSQLYSKIFSTVRSDQRLVATCIGGELHEIGIRMVADFFEMEGWDTYYLGANTPIGSILQTIEAQDADVLAISATIPYHVSKVATLIDNVRDTFAEDQIKIMVGGYPFNLSPQLWKQVRADGFAPSAQAAVQLANRMTGS